MDPRDAELLALKTKVVLLEKKRSEPPVVLTTNGKKKKGEKKGESPNDSQLDWSKIEGTPVHKWRTIKQGDTLEAGGRTNYWCKHHVLPGKWDSMYTWHKPEDCKKKEKSAEEDKDTTKGDSGAGNLQLNSNIKSVLMSNLCLSAEDVDKLLSEAEAQEN